MSRWLLAVLVGALVVLMVGSSQALAAVAGGPVVTWFSPGSGAVGSQIVVMGTGFDGATSVRLGGKEAVFTVDSATQITATVPAGSVKGRVRVETPSGVARSTDVFTTTHGSGAVISSFAPTSGGKGSTVVITGSAGGRHQRALRRQARGEVHGRFADPDHRDRAGGRGDRQAAGGRRERRRQIDQLVHRGGQGGSGDLVV